MEERNGAVWADHIGGMTGQAIAAKYEISHQRVSQIIAAVYEGMPATERDKLVKREADFLDGIRARMMADIEADPPPAFQKGEILQYVDPETEQVVTVKDYSARMAAVDRALRSHQLLSPLLGLSAPTEVHHTVTDQALAAARQSAADAAQYLHGGTDDAHS